MSNTRTRHGMGICQRTHRTLTSLPSLFFCSNNSQNEPKKRKDLRLHLVTLSSESTTGTRCKPSGIVLPRPMDRRYLDSSVNQASELAAISKATLEPWETQQATGLIGLLSCCLDGLVVQQAVLLRNGLSSGKSDHSRLASPYLDYLIVQTELN
jgi:hypothetical protein